MPVWLSDIEERVKNMAAYYEPGIDDRQRMARVIRDLVEYHIAFRDYHQSPYEDKTHPENRKRGSRLSRAASNLSNDARELLEAGVDE